MFNNPVYVGLNTSERRSTCSQLHTLQAAYHWFPEELVLGVVFAENEPGVAFEGPGCLNLQHHLVVLQTSF